MEDDDVDFGHVEHAERHGRAQVHGDGQRGGLDVELEGQRGRRNGLHKQLRRRGLHTQRTDLLTRLMSR